jgi:hypothetical protein
MEFLLNDATSSTGPLNPATVAHSRSRTLTVAYSDFAVQQVRISAKLWALCWVGPNANFYCSSANYPTFLTTIEAQH